jgi:hypothetical protein
VYNIQFKDINNLESLPMIKYLILLSIIILPVYSYASEWEKIGPDTISVDDYLCSIYGNLLCTSEGIYLQSWNNEHENWNSNGQSSGIYFCRLKCGNKFRIKKMILLQ